jgi:hypothetical protein
MATAYLVHGVWLMPDYNAIPASHRTATAMQQRFWVLAIGQVFFAAIFVYIYTRGFATIAQGILYGILTSFFTVIPYSLSEYDTYLVPYPLAIKWMVAGAIQLMIMGVIVAGIYKHQPAHS